MDEDLGSIVMGLRANRPTEVQHTIDSVSSLENWSRNRYNPVKRLRIYLPLYGANWVPQLWRLIKRPPHGTLQEVRISVADYEYVMGEGVKYKLYYSNEQLQQSSDLTKLLLQSIWMNASASIHTVRLISVHVPVAARCEWRQRCSSRWIAIIALSDRTIVVTVCYCSTTCIEHPPP